MPQHPCNGRRRLLAVVTLTGALLANGPGAWAQEATASAAPLRAAVPAGKPASETTTSAATAETPALKGSPPSAKARLVQPPTAMVVPAARNAIDLALEQVPAGVSVEQFLVALFRLNPGAFAEGKIHQLSAGAHLQLPTAEQARALTQERARTELQTLRQAALAPPPSPPNSAADAPATSGSSSTPADAQAGAPQTAGAEASPPAPIPAATTQALPAAAQVQALPIHPWLLISSGGALLILLFLAFRPSEQPRKPPAAANAPAPKAAASGTSPSRDAASSAPVPKSLADFGPLPSLDLDDGPGSGSTRATPQAPAPFDLSRISLDLNPEDKRPS